MTRKQDLLPYSTVSYFIIHSGLFLPCTIFDPSHLLKNFPKFIFAYKHSCVLTDCLWSIHNSSNNNICKWGKTKIGEKFFLFMILYVLTPTRPTLPTLGTAGLSGAGLIVACGTSQRFWHAVSGTIVPRCTGWTGGACIVGIVSSSTQHRAGAGTGTGITPRAGDTGRVSPQGVVTTGAGSS